MVDQSSMTAGERQAAFAETMFAKQPGAASWLLLDKVPCGYCGSVQPINQMRKYTNRRHGNRVNFYCDYNHIRDGEMMLNAIAEYGSLDALLLDTENITDVDEKGRTLLTVTEDTAVCKCGCGEVFSVAKEGRRREFVSVAHRMRYMRAMKARDVVTAVAAEIEAEQTAEQAEMEREIAEAEALAKTEAEAIAEPVEIRNVEEPEEDKPRLGRRPKVPYTEPLPKGAYVFPAGRTFATPIARRLSFPKVDGWRWRCVCGAKAGSMNPYPSRAVAEIAWQLHYVNPAHKSGLERRRFRKPCPVTLHRVAASKVTA